MKPFSKIRISLVRATRTFSNAHVFGLSSPSKGKGQLVGVVAVLLGIAIAGVLAADPVRSEAASSGPHDASTVARARAAFLKKMSSHRPLVRSNVTSPPPSGGVTGGGSYNWSGFADV